jgi:hypothetical protein
LWNTSLEPMNNQTRARHVSHDLRRLPIWDAVSHVSVFSFHETTRRVSLSLHSCSFPAETATDSRFSVEHSRRWILCGLTLAYLWLSSPSSHIFIFRPGLIQSRKRNTHCRRNQRPPECTNACPPGRSVATGQKPGTLVCTGCRKSVLLERVMSLRWRAGTLNS